MKAKLIRVDLKHENDGTVIGSYIVAIGRRRFRVEMRPMTCTMSLLEIIGSRIEHLDDVELAAQEGQG